MIGWLRGILREKQPPYLLVDVQGVGYELEAPMTTFSTLPALGEELTLFTHQVIRDDAHSLYAFVQRAERNVFRQLLRVNGVGAKLALTILSGMDAAALARCVYERDVASLARLPGLGKKTAEKLIIELHDRVSALPGLGEAALATSSQPGIDYPDPVTEAISALVALGFKPQDATQRVQAVRAPGLTCEELVRRALQSLAK